MEQERTRAKHSPLGASGTERWLNCPGSVALLQHLGEDTSDDADYRIEGTAMHAGAAHALGHNLDAWELVGMEFEGLTLTPELVDPLQVYLDYCRSLGGERYVEYPISSPVHPDFYGTLDFASIGWADVNKTAAESIEFVDLKCGQGIMVEIDDNPQLKYYAFGLIDGLERHQGREIWDNDTVLGLTICQPRGFHADGPVRRWETSLGELKAWVHDTLVPAMHATEYDQTLTVGEWCRFCPAKLVCPMLTGLFKAACTANAAHLPDTSDEALGRSFTLAAGVKHYLKALEAECYTRAMRGAQLPGGKLVHKKSNRVWKDGAETMFRERFGDDALTEREFKSPAEMEKVPAAKALVKEHAYTPTSGLAYVLDTDSRQSVIVTPAAERFAEVKD